MGMSNHLRTVRVRWRTVVLAAVLALAAAAGYSLTTPPSYTATSQLFVDTPNQGGAAADPTGGLYAQQRVASYAQILRGPELAQRVADALQPPLPADQLRSETTVDVPPGTVLVTVTVVDSSAPRAQAAANAYADQLVDLSSRLGVGQDAAGPPTAVSVAQRAAVASTRAVGATILTLLLALLVGAAAGAGLVLAQERRAGRVTSWRDLERAGAAPLVAVPLDPDRAGRPLLTFDGGLSASADAHRRLRAHLLEPGRPGVVVVAGCAAGDGASTTALNLAFALAEGGHRVTLVDADPGRSPLAGYLRIADDVGLTTVLAGTTDLDGALQATVSPLVTLLPAGPRTSPLDVGAVRAVVAARRERGDHVVISAPPVRPDDPSAELGALGDAVVLVAQHGVTTRAEVERAGMAWRAAGATDVGAVLNRAPLRDVGAFVPGERHPDPGAVTAVDRPSPTPRAVAVPAENA